MSYVPLWCKSNSSFLEGASHPEESVAQAAFLGLPAVAVTDRNDVFGLPWAHDGLFPLRPRALWSDILLFIEDPAAAEPCLAVTRTLACKGAEVILCRTTLGGIMAGPGLPGYVVERRCSSRSIRVWERARSARVETR